MLKIDAEGGELMVFAGAKHMLATALPRVPVGFHPFAFADALVVSNELTVECSMKPDIGSKMRLARGRSSCANTWPCRAPDWNEHE